MFSVGDLVTLLVVVAILAIYRKLDRNNRALDKVKRYADRITDELSGLIDDKSTEINDLAIEIQVGLKTGKELLKRVRDVEEGLEGRAEQMDEIEQRLNGYDATLAKLVDMSDRVDENLLRVQEESTFIAGVEDEVKRAAKQLESMRDEYPKLQEELHSRDRSELTAIHQQVMEDAERRAAAVAANLASLEGQSNQLNETADALHKRVRELETTNIARLTSEAEAVTEESSRALEAAHRRASELEDSTFSELSTRIDERENELTARLQKLQGQLAQATGEHEELAHKVLAVQDEFEATCQELRASFGERASQLDARLDVQIEELAATTRGKVEEALTDIEREAVATAASRLSEYEAEVSSRLQLVESQQSEFIAFETSFRQLLDEKAEVLRDALQERSAQLLSDHAAELDRVKARFGEVESGLADLERTVNELKARTHRDMSDRLQVFEDDFFADLNTRSTELEGKVGDWQEEVTARLEQLTSDMRSEAENATATTGTELRESIAELRQKTASELERTEASLARFEEGLLERLRGSETIIAEQHSLAREQLLVARGDLGDTFERNTSEARAQLEQELAEAQRTLQQRLGELEQESQASLASLREGVSVGRAEIELRLSELQQEFTDEKTELVDESAEERDRLRMELRALSEGVEHLGEEISLKTESASQEFTEVLRDHEAGFRRRVDALMEEFAATADRQRDGIADMKRDAESEHAQLLAKMQSDAKALFDGVASADRRLKAFADQTKLFERADSLRAELEQRTEDLERRITSIQSQQEALEHLQAEIAGARKIGDDVAAKLSRFQAEKRRIEAMENDFRKLISVSREIDGKLGNIESSKDSLQEIQMKIRELQELEETVENDYERLEKRRDVIDTTASDVDRSFERIGELQTSLTESLAPGIDRATGQLQDLQGQIAALASGKERADRAMKVLSKMDTTMTDLETRMEQMHQARDWLARTETRFEEITQQAQEQVDLLEALTQRELAESGDDETGGAPPAAKRDTVVKLARNNWSVGEIAKATRLSRGEVELILEVSGSGPSGRSGR